MITLKNVTKKFDSHEIINNFSYTFKKGTSYGIIGESGSGKTTLLNIIGKLENETSGEVIVNDKSIHSIKEKDYFRNYVGYLFQNFGLIDNETVKNNLELAFTGRKTTKLQQEKLMKEALNKVQLPSFLDRKIYSLSGGEAQRVALAKIIIKNPPIILADEPTASLDEVNGTKVTDLLLELLDKNKIIIIATHNSTVQKN